MANRRQMARRPHENIPSEPSSYINNANQITGEFAWRIGMREQMDFDGIPPEIIERKVAEVQKKLLENRFLGGSRHLFYKHYTLVRNREDILGGLRRAYLTAGNTYVRMRVVMLFVNLSKGNDGSQRIQVQGERSSVLHDFDMGVETSNEEYSPIYNNDLGAPMREVSNAPASGRRMTPQVNYANPVFNQWTNFRYITQFFEDRIEARLEAGVEQPNSSWTNLGIHAMIINMASTDNSQRRSDRLYGLVGSNSRPCDVLPTNTTAQRVVKRATCESERRVVPALGHAQRFGRAAPTVTSRRTGVTSVESIQQQLGFLPDRRSRPEGSRSRRDFYGEGVSRGVRRFLTGGGDVTRELTPQFLNVAKSKRTIDGVRAIDSRNRMTCVFETIDYLIKRQTYNALPDDVKPKTAPKPTMKGGVELFDLFYRHLAEKYGDDCVWYEDREHGFDVGDEPLLQHLADFLTERTGVFRQIFVYMFSPEDIERRIFSKRLNKEFCTEFAPLDLEKYEALMKGKLFDSKTPASARLITSQTRHEDLEILTEYDLVSDVTQIDVANTFHLLWYNGHVHAIVEPWQLCSGVACHRCSRLFLKGDYSARRNNLQKHLKVGCEFKPRTKRTFSSQREAFTRDFNIIRHLMGLPKRECSPLGLQCMPEDLTFIIKHFVVIDFECMLVGLPPKLDSNGNLLPTQFTNYHVAYNIGIGSTIKGYEKIVIRCRGPTLADEDEFTSKWMKVVEEIGNAAVKLNFIEHGHLLDKKGITPQEKISLMSHLKTLPAITFNGGKYDIPIIQDAVLRYFARVMDIFKPVEYLEPDKPGGKRKKKPKTVDDPPSIDEAISFVKNGKRVINWRLQFENFILDWRDIINIFQTNLKKLLKMFNKSDDDQKGDFPYDECTSFEWLQKVHPVGTSLSDIVPSAKFYSSKGNKNTLGVECGKNHAEILKNICIRLRENSSHPSVVAALKKHNDTIDMGYSFVCNVWETKGVNGGPMRSMAEFSDWYVMLDVAPLVKATEELRGYFSRGGFDILHDCLTIAGLSQQATCHYMVTQSGLHEHKEYLERDRFMKSLPSTIPPLRGSQINENVMEMGRTMCAEYQKASNMIKLKCNNFVAMYLFREWGRYTLDGRLTYGYHFYRYLTMQKQAQNKLKKESNSSGVQRSDDDGPTKKKKKKSVVKKGKRVKRSKTRRMKDLVDALEACPPMSDDSQNNFILGFIYAWSHQQKMCKVCLKTMGAVNVETPTIGDCVIPIPIDKAKGLVSGNIAIVCFGCSTSLLDYPRRHYSLTEESRRLVHWVGDKIIQKPTDPRIYSLLERFIVGGPSVVFTRYGKVGVTMTLEDIPRIIASIQGWDVNSLYPSEMAKAKQPCGPGEYFEWREGLMREGTISNAEFVRDVLNDTLYGFAYVCMDTPPEKEKEFHQLQALFISASIREIESVLGKYTFDKYFSTGPTEGESQAKKRNPKTNGGDRTLVNVSRGKLLLGTESLKWLLGKGLKLVNVYAFIKYIPHSCFEDFIYNGVNTRRYADQHVNYAPLAGVAKLQLNTAYGKTAEKVSEHSQTHCCIDPDTVMEELSSPSCMGEEEIVVDNVLRQLIFMYSKKKSTCRMENPIQVALAVYDGAKLRMLQFYVDFVQKFTGIGTVRLYYMDTDCFVMGWPCGRDMSSCVPEYKLEAYHLAKRNEITPSIEEAVHEIRKYFDDATFTDDIWKKCLYDFMRVPNVADALAILTNDEKHSDGVLTKLAAIYLAFVGKQPGLLKLEFAADEGYFLSSKCYNMTFDGADGYEGGVTYEFDDIDQSSGCALAASLVDDNVKLVKKTQPRVKVGGKGVSRAANLAILQDSDIFAEVLRTDKSVPATNMSFLHHDKNTQVRRMVTQTTEKNAISSLYKKKVLRADGITCDPMYLETDAEFYEQSKYGLDPPEITDDMSDEEEEVAVEVGGGASLRTMLKEDEVERRARMEVEFNLADVHGDSDSGAEEHIAKWDDTDDIDEALFEEEEYGSDLENDAYCAYC